MDCKMGTTSCVICVCVVSWSIFAVALISDGRSQNNDLTLGEESGRQVSQESVSRSIAPKLRRKREEETETLLPMRHSRHRRRGRFKNEMPRARGSSVKKHQKVHEKRNFEKQLLVRNRTLELLGMRILNSTNATDYEFPKMKVNIVLERGIIAKTIGDILGETGAETGLRITDLLMPKIFPEGKYSSFEKKEPGITDFGRNQVNEEVIQDFVRIKSDYAIESGQIVGKERISNLAGTQFERNEMSAPRDSVPASFLRKLKTIAANDSKETGAAVPRMKENNTELDISSGDFYENGYRYDYENVFEDLDPKDSSWINPHSNEQTTSREDFSDSTFPSSVYTPIDDQIALHESLAALLSRLFQTLRNASLLQDLDLDRSQEGDLCQKWLDCKDKLERAFLGPLVTLPACPCHYPSSIFYDDKIWDEGQRKHFRWRDVSGDAERLDVYKPGATYCVRSLLAQGSGSAAAQHCCYDRGRRLLTRGSGAGTPNFVSPEVSATLHERIDILPWRLCKGDFSRYNEVRPPNNENRCKTNPDEEEYQRQINSTKYY